MAFSLIVGGAMVWSMVACGTAEKKTLQDQIGEPSPTGIAADTSLQLHAFVNTKEIRDPSDFSLEIFFENRGEKPVAILPSFLQMEFRPIGTGSVSFVPSEGEPRSPWAKAFILLPREVRKIEIRGLERDEGKWVMAAGTYGLSVRYLVEDGHVSGTDPAVRAGSAQDVHLWVGELQSRELMFRVVPKS